MPSRVKVLRFLSRKPRVMHRFALWLLVVDGRLGMPKSQFFGSCTLRSECTGAEICAPMTLIFCVQRSQWLSKRAHGSFSQNNQKEDATCGAEFCSGDQMTQGERGIDALATVKESEGNHVLVAFGLSTHFFVIHEP